MGMRISVQDGANYRPVARIGDSGPIAFHKMAVIVPAVRGSDGKVHLRLSFVADDWRIDAISASDSWRRPAPRRIPAARIAMADPAQNEAAKNALRDVDSGYLITSPGQSFRMEFDVGSAPNGSARSWLMASQGYYTEWVRGSWIKSATGKPFAANNQTLVEAIRDWRRKQSSMEKQFYSTRISAR
jgi:hypothetical protein